jgi:hypothetical protein
MDCVLFEVRTEYLSIMYISNSLQWSHTEAVKCVRLSVCLSVRPSVRPPTYLPTYRIDTDGWTDRQT